MNLGNDAGSDGTDSSGDGDGNPSGDTQSCHVKVFVRIPHLPEDDVVSIYMYCGNSDATSASDGTTTFDFFEGFDGPDLDEPMWTATGIHSLEFGYLAIQTGAAYAYNFAFHDTGRIEAKMRWNLGQNVNWVSGLLIGREQGVDNNLGFIRQWFNGNSFQGYGQEGNVNILPNAGSLAGEVPGPGVM